MTLREIVAEMRALGVTRYKAEGVEVELGPEPQKPPEPVKEDPPEPEELCPCGHPPEFHSTAGCLEGCDMNLCAGSGQRPAPVEEKLNE